MDSVDDEYRWKTMWLFLSSDWAATFTDELWLPTAAMPQIQAVTRRIVEPWVNANYIEPFSVAHYQLCLAIEGIGGDELVDLISDWRRFIYFGSRSGSKWLWSWRDWNEQYIAEVPAGVAKAFNAFRAALSEASIRHTSRIDAFQHKGLSSWDYAITTMYTEGNLEDLPDLEREVTLEHFSNIVNEIIKENTFVELWPSYCGFLTFEDLNRLFQLEFMRRDEYKRREVFIEFPGMWMFERGRFLRSLRVPPASH